MAENRYGIEVEVLRDEKNEPYRVVMVWRGIEIRFDKGSDNYISEAGRVSLYGSRTYPEFPSEIYRVIVGIAAGSLGGSFRPKRKGQRRRVG